MPYDKLRLGRFWWWIQERESIRRRRSRGEPKPWTDDYIMQSYRFCNVFRERDTVTAWIRENWRVPFAKHASLWFAMYVARMINLPETLRVLDFPYGPDWLWDASDRLKRLTEKGDKVYGSAYVITAGGRSGPKHGYTMECFQRAWENPPAFALDGKRHGVAEMWRQLRSIPGCGPFIAYEVATDLRWTRYCSAVDVFTWANAGPGAKRGIARLYCRDPDDQKGLDFLEEMRNLLGMSREYLPKWFPAMELRDIEHSLCEFDKYMRVNLGEGRPKQKYDGAA